MKVSKCAYWDNQLLTPEGVRFVRLKAQEGLGHDEIVALMGEDCPERVKFMIGLYVGKNDVEPQTHVDPSYAKFVTKGKLNAAGKARVHALAAKSSTITAREILKKMGIPESVISERSMRASLAHAPTRRPPKKKK